MSEMRASRNPVSSKTTLAASSRRARVSAPLRERGPAVGWSGTLLPASSLADTVFGIRARDLLVGPGQLYGAPGRRSGTRTAARMRCRTGGSERGPELGDGLDG